MEKQFYVLLLDDYSIPAFISSEKAYIGTINDIDMFIKAYKEDEYIDEDCTDLVLTYEQYKKGNKNITHCVACHYVPFLTPIRVFESKRLKLNETFLTHSNTWLCDYKMHFDNASTEHIWISYNKKYYRCIRAEIENLGYWNTIISKYAEIDMFWGYPHQLEWDGNKIRNRMFVIEKSFDKKEDMLKDIDEFDKNPNPVFTEVLNDVFGDG